MPHAWSKEKEEIKVKQIPWYGSIESKCLKKFNLI